MSNKFVRRIVAGALAALLATPAASFAQEATREPMLVRPAPSVPVEAISSKRDEKIIAKLLEIRQPLLEIVNRGFDDSISKLDPKTRAMTRAYFVQERNTYAEKILSIYGDLESDRLSHGLWVGAGDHYVAAIRDALSTYKSDVRFLRDYAKNPAAYDISDADRAAAEDRMLDMQRVLVAEWDKWVSPYMQQDYKETGKMDMSFESDVVDATLSYDSYTSIFSVLRGEQSADVKANLALDFKRNAALPTELQGASANVALDAGVKVFSNSGTYVTVRDLSITVNGGLTSEEQASLRSFVESLRGKTIHIPLGAYGAGAPSFDVVLKTLDQSVKALAETPIFTPIIRDRNGDYLLAVNPDAMNQVSTILVRELDVSEDQLSESSEDSLVVVPQVVWRRDSAGRGEFYRTFTPKRDNATGYARLAYDDDRASLIFAARLTGEEYNGTSKLSVDLTKDRYFASLAIPETVEATLDWTATGFDLNATSLESNKNDRTVFSVEGVADFDSRVNLVGTYDGDRLFTASYERVDNRSTYSFEVTSEFPAYSLSSEAIPFVFRTSGYYDSAFGNFPAEVPAGAVEADEWIKQFENSNTSDAELLDGLIRLP